MLILATLAAASAQSEVSCRNMKTKELRAFLADRGHTCNGCAEKSDFINMCEEHKHDPAKPARPEQEEEPIPDEFISKQRPPKDMDVDNLLKNSAVSPALQT